ncbi:hypothetical protein [Sphingobacterium hungaricum]|nr:hypothetical protein [Sphingobacterium hungaricum]
MKKRFVLFGLLVCMLQVAFCQDKKGLYSFKPVEETIKVDGNLKEWEKSLYVISKDSSWFFNALVKNNNLYVGVRVVNLFLQSEATKNGILVNINAQGKKKDGAKLIFPKPDPESLRVMTDEKNAGSVFHREQLLAKADGYHVEGFESFVDGLLSFANGYGLKAVAKLDSMDNLVYECVIPLKLLKLEAEQTKLAIQIAINKMAQDKPTVALNDGNASGGMPQGGGMRGGGGGRGGMRGGAGGGMRPSGSDGNRTTENRTASAKTEVWFVDTIN